MDANSKYSILIVDDEEINIDILVEALGNNYDLSVTMDGETALQAIADHPPDLILLDIMMPGMDGYEVCRKIKADENTRDIPVIFVTVMTEEAGEIKGFDSGAVDYITKPLSPPRVQARVRTHLALHAAQKKLKHQNQALREAARLREEIESIMRHDIKTPLSAIIGVPQLLLMDTGRDPGEVQQLRMIEQSGYRLLQMINLSLDLMKMERGVYTLEPAPVDLLDLIGKIARELEPILTAKGISLILNVDGRPPVIEAAFPVYGEELLCYCMLSNLLKNPFEASPQDAAVSIDFITGATAEIHIRNAGTVPADIRDRVFDKYVTANKDSGIGLGTYSAKLTAETQGGTVALDSSQDRHTTVTVQMPVPP
jgi:CheY-like chemotaxis protein